MNRSLDETLCFGVFVALKSNSFIIVFKQSRNVKLLLNELLFFFFFLL